VGFKPTFRIRTFSPIFLEPLILRARSARKIKGSRKIGEGIAYIAEIWLGDASLPKPLGWGDGCPSPQTPLGKEALQERRSVASLCRGFEADPALLWRKLERI